MFYDNLLFNAYENGSTRSKASFESSKKSKLISFSYSFYNFSNKKNKNHKKKTHKIMYSFS